MGVIFFVLALMFGIPLAIIIVAVIKANDNSGSFGGLNTDTFFDNLQDPDHIPGSSNFLGQSKKYGRQEGNIFLDNTFDSLLEKGEFDDDPETIMEEDPDTYAEDYDE